MTDSADSPAKDDSPAPGRGSFSYNQAMQWELSGAADTVQLDGAVLHAVTVGCRVELIATGRYRLIREREPRPDMTKWIDYFAPDAGISIDAERPPPKLVISFRHAEQRPPIRLAIVHGASQPERVVARAIDVGLTARCLGLSRYELTGLTRQHIAWIMVLFEVTQARALEIMNLTVANAIAEDSPPPRPEVKVVLPTREVTSTIARDGFGDIVSVSQTERSV